MPDFLDAILGAHLTVSLLVEGLSRRVVSALKALQRSETRELLRGAEVKVFGGSE